MTRRERPVRPETRVAASNVDADSGAVIAPVHLSSTYARDSDNAPLNPQHLYGRDTNPGFIEVETLLAQLEQGEDALLFASGMSAAMAVIQALEPGDAVIAPRIMYWALRNWLQKFCTTWGLRLTLVDAPDPDAWLAALEHTLQSTRHDGTSVVWLESPANPTWEVIDIEAACRLAHAHGARVVVDSTVATPVLTRPLTLGADIVMHSASKYLNGHSDVIAGALVCARPGALWKRIRRIRSEQGAIAGAFEAWLLRRGLRTLYLRVPRASASALAIARHFDTHPAIARVLYPGLPGHPGHAIAARQMQGGFGGMLSLRLRGGREAALATLGRVRLFVRATSLGGVESLIEHRQSIEGPRI